MIKLRIWIDSFHTSDNYGFSIHGYTFYMNYKLLTELMC